MVILTYHSYVICAQDLIYTEFFSQGDKVRSLNSVAEHTLCTYFASLAVKNKSHCFHDFVSQYTTFGHNLVPRVSQGGKKRDPGNEAALARRRFFSFIGSPTFASLVFDFLLHSV